jgi:NTE family protein
MTDHRGEAQGPRGPNPLSGRGRIGLALGSGASKGWAHVGVIRALEARGIEPEIVCGSSMGALVGAAYAAGRLDEFEAWTADLEWNRVVSYLDLSTRGGLLKPRRFFEFFEPDFTDAMIEDLPKPFAAVGTDLATGQEVWMRDGRLLDALRATIALPGLVTPARWRSRWLVDGGLVNPVPISLARALGADYVIAVDLNTTLLGRRLTNNFDGEGDGRKSRAKAGSASAEEAEPDADESKGQAAAVLSAVEKKLREATDETAEKAAEDSGFALAERLNAAFRELASGVLDRFTTDEPPESRLPSLYDVLANSINIMQVRIGRSRMAGDPPELLVTPRLGDFGLLDFERSAEAIEEGTRALETVWRSQFGDS